MYLANTGSDHAKCIRLSCTFSDLATAIKKQILLCMYLYQSLKESYKNIYFMTIEAQNFLNWLIDMCVFSISFSKY